MAGKSSTASSRRGCSVLVGGDQSGSLERRASEAGVAKISMASLFTDAGIPVTRHHSSYSVEVDVVGCA